jgi:hypothetical protein
MRLSSAIIIFISLYVNNAQAEIYTCKDENDNTIYTDTPGECVNAKEVEVDALPTLIPTKPLAVPSSNRSAQQEVDKNIYTELVITSPSNDTVIRDNQGNLTINFRVTPALQSRKGHKYVVTVDGTEVYSGSSTITALKNVDRGTHTIGVKVVAQDGSTKISATPINVTLQRFSALQKQNNTPIDNNGVNNGNSGNNSRFPGSTQLPTRPPPPP